MIIISISFIPCDDQHDSHQDNEIAINVDDHDHENDHESCSPLCVCNCCHTNLVFATYNFDSGVIRFNTVGNSLYISSIIDYFKGVPLQPPRL
nr:DUF6660 family protein [Mangrovivirga cuniculi]